MALVYIGLGTNLGDRQKNLKEAKVRLFTDEAIRPVEESSIEETKPVDYTDQPDFLNQVILVRTNIEPLRLLHLLQQIESNMGRQRSIAKGPRIIDLDILLYDERIMTTGELTIPHPAIVKRPFVLRGLVEISRELRDPVSLTLYRDILLKLSANMGNMND
jgi:2-amino-4-hydroxy-6-hydroxymethyldihydropteridine diphosphokinase